MSGSININPLVASASQQTGIPYPLASALFSQESSSGAASPNIGQITSGTAANPGYGMAPISQSDLQDPYKNVLWSLSYLKARAQAAGRDVSDPSQWGQILPSYNGGGDPNYAQHVLSRIGMGSSGSSAAGGSLPADVPPMALVQSSPTPPMPSNFGAPTQPNSPAATVNNAGHQGDPLVAFGAALAGGNGFHDGIAKAGAAYSDAQQVQQKNAQLNASFQNDADNRDAEAPLQAAQAAANRADAWKALNPVVTPDQALTANLQGRSQDIQQRGQDLDYQTAIARQQYMSQLVKGQPQTLVVPAADGSIGRTITQSSTPAGPVYRDESTGQTSSNLGDLNATGAIPSQLYNSQEQRGAAIDKQSAKDVSSFVTAGTTAANQIDSLKTTLANAAKPGALAAPGIINSFGRAFDSLTGTSLFGNLTDEQVAKLGEGQQNWASIRQAIQGTGGRLTNQETSMLTQVFPNIATDPAARAQAAQILSHGLQRQEDLATQFTAMPQPYQTAITRSPGGFAGWQLQATKDWNAAHPLQDTPAAGSATTAPAASGGAQQPPLSSFLH